MVLSSAVVFVAIRHDLVGRVDSALTHHAALLEKRRIEHGAGAAVKPSRRSTVSLGGAPILVQVVDGGGVVVARTLPQLRLPVSTSVEAVATGHARPYFADSTVGTVPVRLFVTRFGAGNALEEIRPIAEVDAELGRLTAVLIVTSAAGVALALLLGAGVAGVALRPVRQLTDAAERVASTRDLAQEIPVEGNDELARLAASVNTMLGALDASQRAQRQLVADASHELRTPLTSLRTNVEVLAESPAMEPEARRQLVADLVAQFDALNALLGDLVELARHDDPSARQAATEAVALDTLVDDAVRRARRDHPTVRFVASTVPASTVGVAADLERVVTNLLDNAAKWSPPHGTVEVSLTTAVPGGSAVSDHRALTRAPRLAAPHGRASTGAGSKRASTAAGSKRASTAAGSRRPPTGAGSTSASTGDASPGAGSTSASTAAGSTAAGSTSAGMAVVSVTDQGPGIAPADLPFIFDRFYRGRGARKLPGSGLGLAIACRIVDSHAGEIHVEPGPGGGTRIVVQLPLDPTSTPTT